MSTNLDVPAAPPPRRAPPFAGDRHGARTAGRSWLGVALLAVAACVAALSLLGPLVLGLIDYRPDARVGRPMTRIPSPRTA